jgi:hypothetical protein
MKRSSFSIASGLCRTVAATCCMLVSTSVFAAYPDTCQIQFLAEDLPFPNVGTTSDSTLITLTTTEATHTADLAANGADMNSFLMYIRDRDCPVDTTGPSSIPLYPASEHSSKTFCHVGFLGSFGNSTPQLHGALPMRILIFLFSLKQHPHRSKFL